MKALKAQRRLSTADPVTAGGETEQQSTVPEAVFYFSMLKWSS